MTDPASEAVLPSATGRLIAPGSGFHPTDEELINNYLKRKVQRKPMFLDLIGEVDVYKYEPSELPEHSRLKTKDQEEWFFFTTLAKHGEGGYINRATTQGYWHNRGAEKEIKQGGDSGQVVGKVQSLVFNTGRPPNHQPTNWVIHEYHLLDNDGHGLKTDAYVLCRLSHNSGNINDDDDDDDGRALVPGLGHANSINEKESNSGSMNIFDLNELPREFEMNDNDPKTVDQDYNNDACLLPCVLNKEAPLPFIQYKRKRQIDSFGSYENSSQTTHLQYHCSSPIATTSESESSSGAE
ncbi:hypothetical protein N665_3017s0001 [Sinapis alba]|nr:hypothetical protein N665_3017s0001 [Sinapis alba]